MQNKNIYIIGVIILLVIVVCGIYFFLYVKPNIANNHSGTASPLLITKQTASSDTIRLATHGSLYIFTDSTGKTLYHDIQDWPTSTKPPYIPHSKCIGSCSVTWPPFYTDSIKISSPLKAGDFMIFTRTDGKKQVAYRGWPLYYYTGDSKPGDANGQNIANIWYAGVAPN